MTRERSQPIGTEDLLKVLESTAAYPVVVTDASAPGASRSGPVDETQRIVDSALRAVLGGRTRVDDPNGLKAALARSFVEDRVDGRRVYRNVPRGSIADTVGEGEVSGFQGALMAHARQAVHSGLPLLESLKSLVPTVDDNDIAARASVVRNSVIKLRDEFGRRDGPRPAVIETELDILVGTESTNDPDLVGGAVGSLREDLGLSTGKYANNIEDEHQLTSYRLLAEYMVGLRTAWQTASPIFGSDDGPAFVSARLRRLELTTQTITESIYQVRTAMDSVNLGEAERRIQSIRLKALNAQMTIEELLEWAETTVSPDSITLIREGGRIAIAASLVPTVQKILEALTEVARGDPLPGGLGAPRVTASLSDLQVQWEQLTSELERLANQSVAVPDVRGKHLEQACEILEKKGLMGTVSGNASGSEIVLSSDPEQGQLVQPETPVLLTVKTCRPRNGTPGQDPEPPCPRDPVAQPWIPGRTNAADWRPSLARLSNALIEQVNLLLDDVAGRLKDQSLLTHWLDVTGGTGRRDPSDSTPNQEEEVADAVLVEPEFTNPAEDRATDSSGTQARGPDANKEIPTPSEVHKRGGTATDPNAAEKNGGGPS